MYLAILQRLGFILRDGAAGRRIQEGFGIAPVFLVAWCTGLATYRYETC